MGSNQSNQSQNAQPGYPMPIQGLMYQTGDLLSDLQNSLVGGGLGTAPGGQNVLGMNAQGQNLYQQMFSPNVQQIPGLTPGQQNVLGQYGARAFGEPTNIYDQLGGQYARQSGQMTTPEMQALNIAQGSGIGGYNNPEYQALEQINRFAGGEIGSSPATIAAMKAARDPALNDLALAGLANSDAVASNLTAAYAPILSQEMALRAGVIPQLAQMGASQRAGALTGAQLSGQIGQQLRGGEQFGAGFLGQLGRDIEQRQGTRLGEYYGTEEAQRQIAAQQSEAAYNDFLRQINAASTLSTGLLGQAPVGALSSGTARSIKAGLK
jgi:hypothetical protein